MKKKSDAAKRKLPKKVVSHPAKVRIRKIPTGVRGLDDILGGGIPEFSFNIIAGAPGCGKTTLAHQIVFANATAQKPALYFTVLGEPALKMLRYQQQYTFFDEAKLGKAIRFINLGEALMNQDLNAVLEEIIKQVTAAQPGFVVVDSFRTMVRSTKIGREKDKPDAPSAAFHGRSRVGQDDGRGHSRRRQHPRSRAFGRGKVRAGDAFHCRRNASGRSGNSGGLRRAPERLPGSRRQFWFESKKAAGKWKTRSPLRSSGRSFSG